MKIGNPFRRLTVTERVLWGISLTAVLISFFLSPEKNVLSLAASLIGVTGLIFVARGEVLGQAITVVFSVFYGIISFSFQYYGEMITYLGMTAPIAVLALISWIRHPYRGTREVEVHRVTGGQVAVMLVLTVAVTTAFWFLLGWLGTANLVFSTVSVATSFLAAYLTFLRSPLYGLGYAANDIVLIVLWSMAAMRDTSCLPMITCCVMFLANDIYGFFNWQRMKRRQLAARRSTPSQPQKENG